MRRQAPDNYSDYERTGNKALDLVAQAVGWSKKFRMPLVSITLSRSMYALYWAGIEILMQKPLPDQHILEFEGVVIKQGERGQIDGMTLQHAKGVKPPAAGILLNLN